MTTDRLQQQIQFIIEIDRLKTIIRRSYITNGERYENSAEHSWHLAMMAIVLAEHAETPIDILRVLKMLLIHDIVEIDAGDTYAYDEEAKLDKAAREQLAADRLFGLLPDPQAEGLRELWNEFEAHITPEAKFATALDRLMPLLHAYQVQGKSWQANGVKHHQVMELNGTIEDGSSTLWDFARSLINDAVARGYLPADE